MRFHSRVHDKQSKIRGNQLVPAAPRVHLPAERAERFDQRLLREMVQVLRVGLLHPRRIALDPLSDVPESGMHLFHFRGSEHADLLERTRPRAIDNQFVGQQPPVERKRTLERIEPLVRRAVEASAPELRVFPSCHFVVRSSLLAAFAARFRMLFHARNCPRPLPSGARSPAARKD